MSISFSGGCACGAIRYSSTSEPLYMGNCHCRDCQQATGSAYFPAVIFKPDGFSLEGELTWFEKSADRGHTMGRGFCSSCGSPVMLKNGAAPHLMVAYAGSLDDPSRYKPQRDIYTGRAQPWDLMDPDLPKVEGMPDAF